MISLRSVAALVPAVLIPVALFGVSLAVIFTLQPIGHDGLVAAVLAALLVLLVVRARLKPGGPAFVHRAQIPVLAVLACWLA